MSIQSDAWAVYCTYLSIYSITPTSDAAMIPLGAPEPNAHNTLDQPVTIDFANAFTKINIWYE